ncbi:MAG: VWA domain-containing protein [Actinobacteria bacterium]|nr:VWA domain-containing protein [Actinomycetota bacterium]
MSVAQLTAFCRLLRDTGVPVGTDRAIAFCEAAEATPGADLYWAGRATLVSRPDEIAPYNRVFATFFGMARSQPPERRHSLQVSGVPGGPDPGTDQSSALTELPDAALASVAERLRHRSFARMSAAELRQVARLMARLRLAAPPRRTARRRAARRGDVDVRRTLRRALRTGGDPIALARRARRVRPRRIVLVLDISGSMGAYSRALLMFAHGAIRADQRWEAFSFGTRLTRLTGALRRSSPDAALDAAATEALDWDGGTRIGESIRALLAGHGGGTVRGALVVILSDGLDVGSPEILAREMARLGRLAHRVVWVNPLQENPEYEPLARGMAAALPYVNTFVSGHNLAELESLTRIIARS